ncbi:hypothetical protein EH230_13855 [Flavobacterium columnare]|uniref:Uncharacterized protein n=2 Tax=Flavobacterium TaxID=237 RepID=A0A246GH42_9FLAO|nr:MULTISPECIES: hypothetical protein [Flavobacterium]OWP83502.1 hypothetical protein BWK59_10125 [Flavobacterium davisii]RVU89843.1 hypothetical protein EH230_13855 [Flavobacterium columnare]
MNRNIKKVVIGLVVITILALGFKFLVISWLSFFSNPNRGTLSEKEILLFKALKKEFQIIEIERDSDFEEKNIREDIDTITYKIYLYYDKRFDTLKMENTSKVIFKNLEKLDLNKNIYKYEIVFCKNLYNPIGKKYEHTKVIQKD